MDRVSPQDDRRSAALRRFEEVTELPLLVLALALVPLLLLPLEVEPSGAVESVMTAAEVLIWMAFALHYGVRLVLTTQRWRFVRREWLDLVVIALPFLRPLRVARSARALRLVRLARLTALLGGIAGTARRLLVRHRLHYVLLVTMAVVLGGALVTLVLEKGRGGTIDSVGDALWWAFATVTTVGYGDAYPVTPAGRAVAAVLMVTGIATFGALTANFAAFLLDDDEEVEAVGDAALVDDRLDEILNRLVALEVTLLAAQACPTCESADAIEAPAA